MPRSSAPLLIPVGPKDFSDRLLSNWQAWRVNREIKKIIGKYKREEAQIAMYHNHPVEYRLRKLMAELTMPSKFLFGAVAFITAIHVVDTYSLPIQISSAIVTGKSLIPEHFENVSYAKSKDTKTIKTFVPQTYKVEVQYNPNGADFDKVPSKITFSVSKSLFDAAQINAPLKMNFTETRIGRDVQPQGLEPVKLAISKVKVKI